MKVIIALVSLLILFSCKSDKTTMNEKDLQSTTIPELNWNESQILATQLANTGESVENKNTVLLKQNAINDVELFLNGGNGCGGRLGCGKWEYVRNKTSDKAIQATVKTSWIYQNQNRSETKVYSLSPGEEIHLGCTAWCSSSVRQDFKRKIVGAMYL